MLSFPPNGLYAITAPDTRADMLAAVAASIDGGAAVIQYRDKSTDEPKRRRQASMLVALCASRGVPLIVNDDVILADEVGAHGVHIGRDDGSLDVARRKLGDEAIIGVSCYADLDRAEQAVKAGASYVAFGSFFPSVTKPTAPGVTADILSRAREKLGVPIVAIGGIDPNNGKQLIASGATHLAVISAIFGKDFGTGHVEQAARRFSVCFEPS